MQLQILKIILWPKRKQFAPRELPFEPGRMNVLSGISKTGKSAIIPILDYCLGSSNCTIPVNTIRDSCEWFGVLIQTSAGQKLLARQEPGNQKSTDNAFVLESPKIEIPVRIEAKNCNRDYIKKTMDQLAGLTGYEFDPTSQSGFDSRPSFRDMISFNFQPQNLVANPNVLFFKADSFKHREKLKTIFPYVLGAVTPDTLAKRHELSEKNRELKRKIAELEIVAGASRAWRARLDRIITQATQLGLISPKSGQLPLEVLRELIKQSGPIDAHPSSETMTAAAQELNRFLTNEQELSSELVKLRKRLKDMTSLRLSATRYGGALEVQRERLAISRWLNQRQKKPCPICDSDMTPVGKRLDELVTALGAVEQNAHSLTEIPVVFDQEYETVRSEIARLIDELTRVQGNRRSLEEQSQLARQTEYTRTSTARFMGRVEAELDLYEVPTSEQGLQDDVARLRVEISELQAQIAEGQMAAREGSALRRVNRNIENLVKGLNAERPDAPVNLSPGELTIKVEGNNRDDYLWEIGSGANWVSYHVSTLLGLHEFFLAQIHSPVPSFIVFDQPSQVYFPKNLSRRLEGVEDADVEAVKRIFSTISGVTNQRNGSFQSIVLDHAPKEIWGTFERVNEVEDWHEGGALVPTSWYS